MSTPSPLQVTIGVVLYQSDTYSLQPYLAAFFDSLLAQTGVSLQILVLDNGSPDKSFLNIVQGYRIGDAHERPLRVLTSEKNLGFGGGHNYLMRQSTTPYYLALNPDMVLQKDCVAQLLSCMESHLNAGAVTGKVYRMEKSKIQAGEKIPLNPPLSKGEVRSIDTVGLGYHWRKGFINLGEGEQDRGQFDAEKEVLGASGAMVLFKKEALQDIKSLPLEGGVEVGVREQDVSQKKNEEVQQPEYFDELMFMYKEDIDLSLRLHWAGYAVYYTPQAVAYHARSIATNSVKSKQMQRWSYLHEKIVLAKHIDSTWPSLPRLKIHFRHWLKVCYARLFARFLLIEEGKFHNLLPIIEQKKRMMPKKISGKEMARWF